jgi:capsular exopolysaccharide synthesis family protein
MFNPQPSSSNQLKDITERLNNNFDIGIIAFLFNKSRFYIIGFFIVSFSLAFLYLRYSQAIFESRAVLQINDASKTDAILKLNNLQSSDNVLAEAIEQIKSKVFLKRVVEKLDISVNYFSEGTFKNNELYHSSPYLLKINPKPGISYGQNIYVELNNNLTGGTIKIGSQIHKFDLNTWLKLNEFDINIFLNPKITKEQITHLIRDNKAFYFTVSDIDNVTANLQSKLKVTTINELAKTILIKVDDVNSAKSTDIVNAITEEYNSYDVERKSESSSKILSFIDAQLGIVYNDLKSTENDLQRFKKDKNFNDKDIILNSELMRYTSIEDQMLKVDIEEKIIGEIQGNINKNKSIDIYQLISLISGTEYESLVKDITQSIQKLLVDKENMLYQVTPSSEQIKQINYQLEIQKKLLIESLDAVRLKYKSKYKNLLEKSNDYKSKLSQNPDDEVEFSRLTRLYGISEKYYTMLLEKKTEFSISKAGYVSKNIILEKAQGPGGKVSPNQKNSILIAFLVSVLLSVGLVFIRYIFHDKIYTLNDITKYSKGEVSLLGIIPRYTSNIPVSQLIVDKNPKSLISEAFRTIRTNLGFIDNTDGPKIISITSTISGEGKTFVAINIAGILAFTGKKVVIIDLDMRKPKIHKGFGVNNNIGMSTILTNVTTVDECFNDSPMENLKFITAGPSPPNPSELILNKKLDEVIEYLKLSFDYVVIDNAPIGLVTDGIATIQKANYPIYVFRAGYSKKMFTQILDKLKNESNIKDLAVVLNDVDISRKIYSYNYGYGYGYGYGGGYGGGYYSEAEEFEKKTKKKK